MITGTGAATYFLGYPETWPLLIYASTPNHQHVRTGQTFKLVVNLDGEYLDNVFSVCMVRDGYSILVGQVFEVQREYVKALFEVSTQPIGTWKIKATAPDAENQIEFDILEADMPTVEQIATGVWNFILSTHPDGSTGTKMSEITTALSAIKGTAFESTTDSLAAAREVMEKILVRNKRDNPMLHHRITQGAIIDQIKKGK